MSTKKTANKCKIPIGRKPTRKRYRDELCASRDVMKLFPLPFAKHGARKTKDTTLPPPHDWPEYGGECWRQAHTEILATQAVAYTFLALSAALRAGYMPLTELAKYQAAYNLAKIQYGVAWGAMDDCLDLIA